MKIAPERLFLDAESQVYRVAGRKLKDSNIEYIRADLAQAGGWLPIESAPMDGTEFVAAYGRQGFVKELISYNRIHGYWQSKGKAIPKFQATHWTPLPEPTLSGKQEVKDE